MDGMTLTMKMLEQLLTSEVENLHVRVDETNTQIDIIETRLDSIERQLSVLYLAVEDLKVEVAMLREMCVAKDDLHQVVTDAVEKALTLFAKKYFNAV